MKETHTFFFLDYLFLSECFLYKNLILLLQQLLRSFYPPWGGGEESRQTRTTALSLVINQFKEKGYGKISDTVRRTSV